MRALRATILRFAEPFRRGRRDRELADELESHLALHAEENERRGMSPDEARRQAVLSLGGVEQTKERVRDRRGLPWIETLLQDVRFGARMLAKQPGFTLIALLVLTLGIGASIATFSVVDTVLLHSYPFRAPERLVMLWESTAQEQLPTSFLNFLDWKAHGRAFESMSAYRNDAVTLAGDAGRERVRALVVSADFLRTLGVAPARGRDFTTADDRVGAEPVAILTDAAWRSRFHADPAILGRAITVRERSATVIGVLPRDFEFPSGGELLVPLASIADRLRERGRDTGLLAIGRLRPGVSLDRARVEMEALMAELVRQYPEPLAGRRIATATFFDFTVGDLPRTLWTLMGAVGFVLLIACTNVANMLLSRAAVRRREVAIRTAMGATRGRVIRQFLTESLLLSLAGGLLGLLVARFLIHALVAFGPGDIPRLDRIAVDGRLALFTLSLSVVTGLVYGVLPAHQISSPRIGDALKEAERGSTPGRRSLGPALVVAEVALALVLLIGGGLMLQSFWRLHRVDPGFRPEHVLTLEMILPDPSARARPARALLAELGAALRGLPGVRGVAFSDGLPYRGTNQVPIAVEGRPTPEGGSPIALRYVTSPEYAPVLGIRLLRGRGFAHPEPRDGSPVALVDDVLASKYFAGEDPIGRRLRFDIKDSSWRPIEIVGVVGHVKDKGLDASAQVQPQLYLSLDQASDTLLDDIASGLAVLVRTTGDPAALAPAVRRELTRLEPGAFTTQVVTMEALIADTLSAQRFSMLLLSVFALLALVLAVVGLYGSMAYHVSQRHHEFGIRMALGARAADVFRIVLRRGLALTTAGLAIGIAAALALTRALANLLYGVTATDARTYLAIALLFTLIAALASWIPARRATRVDPMVALRWE